MDNQNRYDSPNTHKLMRLEALLGLTACVALVLTHFSEVQWLNFIVLFASIDILGYLPGAVAFRKSKGQRISSIYYLLYNTMHSLLSGAVIAGLWVLVFGFEWAILAIPIHLFSDRALFGNYYKPFSAPFEPQLLSSFANFEKELS
ncbi:MAG: hypothetical protein P1V97_26185 [Planctomycetota bacterium]|nr:hypothetical protein [Planctomycetota bacterium]